MGELWSKGTPCVYCAGPGTTKDHIFAKKLFAVVERDNLPLAPACFACNNEKSRLEDYLASVLPFGSLRANASEMLAGTERRLAKNLRLARALQAGADHVWYMRSGVLVPGIKSIPIDAGKVEAYLRTVTRALVWLHFNLILDQREHATTAVLLTHSGKALFERLMVGRRTSNSLANGAVVYTGVQSKQNPEVTAWRFTLFGGLKLGEPGGADDSSDEVGAITGRRHVIERLERALHAQ